MAAPPIAAPGLIAVSVAADMLLLEWNQVPNANYYQIYYSAQPEGPWSLLPGMVIDPDLLDGVVQASIPVSGPRMFFRVTALY